MYLQCSIDQKYLPFLLFFALNFFPVIKVFYEGHKISQNTTETLLKVSYFEKKFSCSHLNQKTNEIIDFCPKDLK